MDDSNRNINGMAKQFDNARIADWRPLRGAPEHSSDGTT